MCGRYTLIANTEAIRLLFEVPAFDERLVVPRYNIAPTQPIVIVRQGARGRELVPVRWGLIPGWVKEARDRPLLIMARAEGIDSRPAFRGAFRYRRCLIPASGFYEWQARGPAPRQPFLVSPASPSSEERLIAFAGLWETWLGADGSEIDSAAIVTTNANEAMRPIHDRMPLVLAPEDFETWLSPATHPEEALSLLKPAPDNLLTCTPISLRVNSVANDDPGLWEEARIEENAAAAAKPTAETRQGSLF